MKNNKIIYLAFFIPVVVAGLMRFWDLDLRPFHSDEGVNSFFLRNLYDRNHYHYDPANYHGPFLYYIGLLPFYIFGMSDFSFRLLPVLFGIMIVALLYPLRKRLGWVGLLTSGLLIAVSPADSFFARDTIHETYLVFFSLATVVSFFLYGESRKSRYLYLAAASMAFTVTVKETYIIIFTVFGISIVGAYIFEWILRYFNNEVAYGINGKDDRSGYVRRPYFRMIFISFIKECWQKKYVIIIAIGIFILINFLFYSSFFTYYKGVKGILTTLMIWTETGTHGAGGHAKPFIYYFTLLRKYELPILVLGVCGILYSFKTKQKFAVFVGLWSFFMFLIYSMIPYKTPWLVINFTIPLAVSAGIFVNGLYDALIGRGCDDSGAKVLLVNGNIVPNEEVVKGKPTSKVWCLLLFYIVYVPMFGFFCYQSVIFNFCDYDDDRYELVYVQTSRDIFNLLDTLDELSEVGGKDMVINVVGDSYWPLPWYLREYKNAKFWGKMISNPGSAVILARKNQTKELEEKLKGSYKTRLFEMRPSVWFVAHIQKGLYEAVYGAEAEPGDASAQMQRIPSMEELKPGLHKTWYYNIEFLGEPFLITVENKLISFDYNSASKPYRSPFSIKWEGYLMVEKVGAYQIATKSDDGSVVSIDGEIVVENGGFHAAQHVSGTIFLNKGLHHIKIEYFDGGGGAVMQLLWRLPGSGDEVFIPADVMFSQVTD